MVAGMLQFTCLILGNWRSLGKEPHGARNSAWFPAIGLSVIAVEDDVRLRGILRQVNSGRNFAFSALFCLASIEPSQSLSRRLNSGDLRRPPTRSGPVFLDVVEVDAVQTAKELEAGPVLARIQGIR